MNLTKMLFIGYDFDTDGKWFKCSECNENILVPIGRHSEEDVKYCPLCGRKIVEFVVD